MPMLTLERKLYLCWNGKENCTGVDLGSKAVPMMECRLKLYR